MWGLIVKEHQRDVTTIHILIILYIFKRCYLLSNVTRLSLSHPLIDLTSQWRQQRRGAHGLRPITDVVWTIHQGSARNFQKAPPLFPLQCYLVVPGTPQPNTHPSKFPSLLTGEQFPSSHQVVRAVSSGSRRSLALSPVLVLCPITAVGEFRRSFLLT